MKHTLHLLTFFALILLAIKSQSQVTRLSNNTNIQYGLALGSMGVLTDKNGAIWHTDGTEAGTVIYTTKVFLDSTSEAVLFNNKIYFNGRDALTGTGNELWVTDGTDAGTQLVKDINSGSASSSPQSFIVFNNVLYFFATTVSNGTELWKTDGTTTVLVKDIYPGTASGYDTTNTTFFASNNILYFDANDGTHGTELWKTDGSGAGTVMVKDINPGSGSSNCGNFATLGTEMLFSATEVTDGTELWKSNGTDAGTVLVKDIVPGTGGSSPGELVAFNGKIFFTVFAGVSPLITQQMYSTDGTSTGTTLVKDFGFGGAVFLSNSIFINNKMYFDAGDLTHGFELWSSDGTPTGTVLFDDINPGANSSIPIILQDFQSLVNGSTDVHTKLFNGKIFFIADDGTHGGELWITDGVDSTSAHTHIVKDIEPGADSSLTDNLSWFYTGSSFYFAAYNSATGNELYSTDGTEANTALVKDINPGAASSNPFMFMLLNNHIYLTADDGDGQGNTDLYDVDAETPLPVGLLSFAATLNSKDVDLLWTTVTENNTKNFVVQRSSDAARFTNIGTVNAAGNSAGKINYTFIDPGAFAAGVNTLYYRLQMVDKDGKFSYSKIASVQILPDGKLVVVYPNPVKDKLVIVANNALSSAVIRVTDQSGKIVLTQQLENVQAGTKNTINVSTLSSGIYHLQLISNNSKQTTQFIKY